MVDLIALIVEFFTSEVTLVLLGNRISVSWSKIGLALGLITFLIAIVLNSGPQMQSRRSTTFLRCVLIAPVIEEVIFRFILISTFYIIFGNVIVAIVLSAGLFGLMHVLYGGMRFIDSFITGLLWGWAFLAIGIHVTILAHMTHNFLATLTGG